MFFQKTTKGWDTVPYTTMGIFQTLRDRNRVIRWLVEGQKTVAYPILFGLLCFLSGISGKAIYIPIFWFLCATVAFAALFTDDHKVFLVPMLMIYYGLGQDTKPTYNEQLGNVLNSFELDGLLHMCVSGGVMILAFLIRVCADGTVLRALKKRGICFWGILALDAVFLTNGLFAKNWVPMNLLYGAFLAMGLTVFYLLALSMTEHSRDPLSYACQTMVCLGYTVLGQVTVQILRAWRSDLLFIRNIDGQLLLRRDMFQLSWGIVTLIGAVLALCIPAAMYLARNRRFSGFLYFSALLFLLGTFAVNARAALFVGALAFLICVILNCAGGRNRKKHRIYTACLLLLGLAALPVVHVFVRPLDSLLSWLLDVLRLDRITDGGRFALWKNGLGDFLASPVFGAGFWDGGYAEVRQMDHLYSSMYHNIFVEFLGAMGLVGLIAFLFHLRGLCEIFFRRFSAERLMLLAVPVMVLAMSMLDNFFFYLNFQIFYAIFLALAEYELERKRIERLADHKARTKEKKPRVVFPYVEAGKGHIIPEGAVCRSFREKYGHRAEVVESHFYTETGDRDLEKTERLFVKAVKQQNKNCILSLLCGLGNFVCGDRFALYFLMTRTFSGLRSQRPAMKHLEELEADVVFTTHWSIAFYAGRMKKDRPYTVCLCPDPYSNGMFNVDVNAFWLPSRPGAARAEGRRMYAGGNIRAVPFPIRAEAEALKERRSAIRAELGISETDFVVTLSDGGYGMARLEKTVRYLLKKEIPMTVIALCGTNRALYDRLCGLKASSAVRWIPVSYTEDALRYVAAADLFCGKSGANSMAEPAYFGIPAIITKCITYIERDIKNYYVKHIGSAIYLPSAKKAAERIALFAREPALLAPYREALARTEAAFGAEAVADLLWQEIEQNT